jgi:hypothetical protein
MSGEAEVKVTLEEQVVELTKQVEALLERLNNLTTDTDESSRQLAKRINEYCKRCDEAISAVGKEVAKSLLLMEAELRQTGQLMRADVYNTFSKAVATDAVAQAVAQVTSETIADSLTKRVLVTRPAQRHEMADAVVVRLAQKHELQ